MRQRKQKSRPRWTAQGWGTLKRSLGHPANGPLQTDVGMPGMSGPEFAEELAPRAVLESALTSACTADDPRSFLPSSTQAESADDRDGKMAHDVFISYASGDKTVADAVCATLESQGVRCWIAPRDVVPGMAYGEAIIEAIQGCRIMILVFSSKANVSAHIPKEIERAVSKGAPVIPLRIEDVVPGKSLDYFIGNVHWLDALKPPLEGHLQRLAQNVQTLLSRDRPAMERTGAPPVAAPVSPVPVQPGAAGPAQKQTARPSLLYAALGAMGILVIVLALLFFLRKPAAVSKVAQPPTSSQVVQPPASPTEPPAATNMTPSSGAKPGASSNATHSSAPPTAPQLHAAAAPRSKDDAKKSPSPAPLPNAALGRANIVQAVVRNGETSLQLPPARMYLYGMVTGGAFPSTAFAAGQYAKAVDAAGLVAAALAHGNSDQNSYTSQTQTHLIGGVSVSGSWDSFKTYYGSNQKPGATEASTTFTLPEESLVVVMAFASAQNYIKLQGVSGLQTDASSGRQIAAAAMIVAHAYLPPGTYTITEASSTDVQHPPQFMADLIGVFVFGSKR
jgi:hypothetical protein